MGTTMGVGLGMGTTMGVGRGLMGGGLGSMMGSSILRRDVVVSTGVVYCLPIMSAALIGTAAAVVTSTASAAMLIFILVGWLGLLTMRLSRKKLRKGPEPETSQSMQRAEQKRGEILDGPLSRLAGNLYTLRRTVVYDPQQSYKHSPLASSPVTPPTQTAEVKALLLVYFAVVAATSPRRPAQHYTRVRLTGVKQSAPAAKLAMRRRTCTRTNVTAVRVISYIPARSDDTSLFLHPWHKDKSHPIAMTLAERSLVYPRSSSLGRPSTDERAVIGAHALGWLAEFLSG